MDPPQVEEPIKEVVYGRGSETGGEEDGIKERVLCSLKVYFGAGTVGCRRGRADTLADTAINSNQGLYRVIFDLGRYHYTGDSEGIARSLLVKKG